MKYLATFDPAGLNFQKECDTLVQAEEWLDSMNNNLEYDTIIDTIDDNNRKTDGFFYTQKAK